VVLLQALVIGAGWYFTVCRAKVEVSRRVLDEVLEERRRTVERFATLLEAQAGGRLDRGSAAWDTAQSFVESYRFPQGATLMILDETGLMLCHPDLRQTSGLESADFGLTQVTLADTGETMSLGSVRTTHGSLAHSPADSGSIALAIVHSPTLGALVVARQPRLENSAAGVRVTDGVTVWSGIAALLVVAISGLGSLILVRRYDSMLLRMNGELSGEVERQVGAAMKIRNGIIMGLAKLADHRDNDTGRHLERIRGYCEILARELRANGTDIDDAWIERLSITSTMHDIGKVGVPDAILLKPGPLTMHERRIMERHPLIGADTLVEVRRHVGDDQMVDMATDVSLYHHEKWDGSGYPFGLSAEEIPLAARIVALADVYDALTSWRVYKEPMSHAEAMRIILGSKGTHFDPAVADAFGRTQANFDEIRKTMDEDTIGITGFGGREKAA
jgi:HD-GYP domain-containing protein (c-di-GMP phosphodiesterase class II)